MSSESPAVNSSAIDSTPLALGVSDPSVDYERPPAPAAALRELRSSLGEDAVSSTRAIAQLYAKTTLPAGTTPLAIVTPASKEQVQLVVQIATRHRVATHAISCGKNWGYGDACASTDGQIIVDLKRMNEIVSVDSTLGTAVIQPGVTQADLYEHLRSTDSPFMLDVTGAGPDASIVGNILQRGFGHTPYGDRFGHTSWLEAVLPNGSITKTGFGRYDNAVAQDVFPYGVGPWTAGALTQSSAGIVTEACVQLMPRPEVIEGFALAFDGVDKLAKVVERLRELRLRGTVRSTVHIANDLRVLSGRGVEAPDTPADEALSSDTRASLRRRCGVGEWNLLGALYGSRGEVKAARAEVRRAFRGVAAVRSFRRGTIEMARSVLTPLSGIGRSRQTLDLVETVSDAFDLLEGKPNRSHLTGARWRQPPRVGQDDLRDCGLLWLSPVVPMQGSRAQELMKLVEPIFAEHGFDLLITLTSITERALCGVISCHFDKASESASQRAAALERAVWSTLNASGYYPYRKATSSPAT